MSEGKLTLANLPADLLRHVLSFSEDTAPDVARARRVCAGWTCALSSQALRANGGLDSVCVINDLRLRVDESTLSSVLGVRTRILHATWYSVDVRLLHLASEQCPRVCELRVIDSNIDVQLTPRWPQLARVVFLRCIQLTDASIIAIARLSPLLTSVKLRACSKLTDASIVEVVRACPGLMELDVSSCSKLTDASIVEVGRGCPGLTHLFVSACVELTDASIVEVARGCPALKVLDVFGCSKLTDASIAALARGCPELTELVVFCCRALTPIGKASFKRQLPNCTVKG